MAGQELSLPVQLPEAFVTQMKASLGPEFAAFEASLSSPSPVSIRYNLFKEIHKEIGNPVPWCQEALYLSQRPEFVYDPFWHGGGYYVQEAGSMFAGHALKQLLPKLKHPIVLDMCAAPGGKSTHLLSLLQEAGGLLVSNEIIKTRLHILQENLTKWGLPNVVITHNDSAQFSILENFFDVLMVDAPCSGEGLFRKQHDAVNEWSEQQVTFCAERQKEILENLWLALKPGGYLIYSTCTYNRQENEENVEWLVQEYEAQLIDLEVPEDWNIVSGEGYHFYPHKTQSEGFYLAVLQKPHETYSKRSISIKRNYFSKLYKEELAQVEPLFQSEGMLWRKQPKGVLNLLPERFYEEIEYLAYKLNVVQTGLEAIEIKGKDFNPLQSAANSLLLSPYSFSHAELDLDTALRYLSKQDFTFEGEIGLNLLRYEGLPLGWAKKMPNRVNNYYPQEWRIRQVRKS